MDKRIVYVFYIFDDIKSFDEIPSYQLHFNCLRHFANVFDKADIIISVDDLSNPLIEEAQNFFNETFANCDEINIYVEQNVRKHREGIWYLKYIVNRIHDLNDYVWFGHSKGVQNAHWENKFPYQLITTMYYWCLTADPFEVMGDKYPCYGFPITYYKGHGKFVKWGIGDYMQNIVNLLANIEDYKHNEWLYITLKCTKYNNWEHVWQYVGANYWINCPFVSKFIKDNNIAIDFSDNRPPLWYDIWTIAENFMNDLFEYNEVNFPYKDRVIAVNEYIDRHGIIQTDGSEGYQYHLDEYMHDVMDDYFPHDAIVKYDYFHKKMMANITQRKTIGIFYDLNVNINKEQYENGSYGGSETWVINLSKYLQMAGFNVVVMCATDKHHIDEDGVEWIPLQYRHNINHLKGRKFDLVIASRNITSTVIELYNLGCTQNILFQAHDVYIFNEDMPIYYDNEFWHHPCVKGCVVLTEYHKQLLHEYYGVPLDKLEVIGNGIEIDKIDKIEEPVERDNGILFSSCAYRGLDIVANEIMPIIKKEIPDAHLYFATYYDVPDYVHKNENITFLGGLNKTELYKEMKKHKIWIYPSNFSETFCITAIENALCGNELVTTYQCGVGSIFKLFDYNKPQHKMRHNFILSSETNIDDELCKQELAEIAIQAIKNYDTLYANYMRETKKKYIRDNFSWESIANQWKELINKILS